MICCGSFLFWQQIGVSKQCFWFCVLGFMLAVRMGAQNSANRSQLSPSADDSVRTQVHFSNINHHIIIHQSSINELIDDTLTNH